MTHSLPAATTMATPCAHPPHCTSQNCIDSLRPVAYSTLAELVASCKGELTLAQLEKAVVMFIR